jgi:hypothetical protein
LIATWFGVMVPLHPRGAIKLGGGGCRADARACCHPDKAGQSHSRNKPADSQCAICHFLAALDLPTGIGMDVPPLGGVDQVEPDAPLTAPTVASLSAASERGPPIA